ncbi:MAG: hypothetical protein ACYCPP_00525 [Nitrososphaerales archaeon]
MREELSVAHSIISFDSLNDLLSELDRSIDTYSKLTKRYEDRLGILLRQAKDSNDPKLQAVSAEGFSSGQNDSEQQNKKKKEDKKRDSEEKEKGWIILEAGDYTIRLANGPDTQTLANEVSLLFKVIETLRSKTVALEASRKMISELASQGFKSDRRLRVVFRDGLPKYMIPSSESSIQQGKKFRYGEQFRLAVLK